ncbi:hypothetical protein EVAR_49021_1 [Eumeta japonica]|uniref:Uncharacterized protein n=1 Tax=Eumeta variegata TaxID=151549 RepID=A0A4C1XN25_EUMVA|nr:hypothetical protein EVAR_49021_1 [Eumeta japonica]
MTHWTKGLSFSGLSMMHWTRGLSFSLSTRQRKVVLANERVIYERVGDHRRPWTPPVPSDSPVLCSAFTLAGQRLIKIAITDENYDDRYLTDLSKRVASGFDLSVVTKILSPVLTPVE